MLTRIALTTVLAIARRPSKQLPVKSSSPALPICGELELRRSTTVTVPETDSSKKGFSIKPILPHHFQLE